MEPERCRYLWRPVLHWKGADAGRRTLQQSAIANPDDSRAAMRVPPEESAGCAAGWRGASLVEAPSTFNFSDETVADQQRRADRERLFKRQHDLSGGWRCVHYPLQKACPGTGMLWGRAIASNGLFSSPAAWRRNQRLVGY